MTKLSIIIVNWNTAKLLGQCLESVISDLCLENGKAPPDVNRQSPVTNHQSLITEIIIVDNGSTDGSVEMIESFIRGRLSVTGKNKPSINYRKLITGNRSPITLRLIKNKENLGFAKGNNIGIKEARGEYIMLLNSDTIVKEGAVERLLKVFEKQTDKVGAVSPLLINTDGSIQKDPCFLKFPSPILILFYYNSLLKKLALNFFPKLLFSITDFSKTAYVDQLPGAAILIRKKVLDRIGIFDEDYQIYFEDTDLCFRMKKAGYKLLLAPEAKIIHLGRQSIKSVIDKEGIEKFYLLNFQSLFRFCKKHYSFVRYQTIKTIVLKQMFITLKFNLFKKLLDFE